MSFSNGILSTELSYHSITGRLDPEEILGIIVDKAKASGVPLTSPQEAVLRQSVTDFIARSRPFLVRPIVQSAGGTDNSFLFIPIGNSEFVTGETKYLVVRFDGRNLIQAREINHLPYSASKNDRKPSTGATPEQRLKWLMNFWEKPEKIYDSKYYSKRSIKDLSFLFDPQKLKQKSFEGLKDWLQTQAFANTIPINIFGPDLMEKILELTHDTLSEAYSEFFKAIDDPDAIETMQALDGVQTTRLFQYIRPFEKKSTGEKKARFRSKEFDEGTAAKRREFLKTFPFAAGFIEERQYDRHSAMQEIDKGIKPELILQRLLGRIGNKTVEIPEAVFDFLKGQTLNGLRIKNNQLEEATPFLAYLGRELGPQQRATLSSVVLNDFDKLIPYLSYLPGPEFYPDSPLEWLAFRTIVEIDQKYAGHYFKLPGQVVTDSASSLKSNDNSKWQNFAKHALFVSGEERLPLSDYVLRMADFVIKTRIVPLVLNIRAEKGITSDIDEGAVVAMFRVLAPHLQNALTNRSKKMLEETGLNMAGRIFSDIPFPQLLMQARGFRDGDEAIWDLEKRRLAVREAFSERAGEMDWKALPSYPDGYEPE